MQFPPEKEGMKRSVQAILEELDAKKRLDSSHRNRVGQKAEMMINMYKVHVQVSRQKGAMPQVSVIKDKEWRNCYQSLVTKRELLCLYTSLKYVKVDKYTILT